MMEVNTSISSDAGPEPPLPVPACQECGRQDETLRLVIYPFVVSLVFITFRRNFRGLWCSAHRTKHLALAGLISTALGWFGIPFGLVFTPVALYQLARGGIQPADPNVRMLRTLAEDRAAKGDSAGAVRCLEECLKFKDDPEIQRRLNELRPHYGPQQEPVGCLTAGLRVLATLYLAIFIGIVVGMVDYGTGYLIGKTMGPDVPVFFGIAGWLPLVAGTFIACILAKGRLEQSLVGVRAKGQGLAISFGILAALMLTYGIFQGALIGDNINASVNSLFDSQGQAVLVWILTLVGGGLLGGYGAVSSLPSNWIYVLLVGLATLFFLLVIVQSARDTTQWQRRIDSDTRTL